MHSQSDRGSGNRNEVTGPGRAIPGGNPERNLRNAWLLLTYALAADIVYRAGFLRAPLNQMADLVFIWLGAQLFYLITEISLYRSVVTAWRMSVVPATVLGIVLMGAALILYEYWGAGIILAGFSALAVVAVLALLVVARRKV